ncbi:DUF481 domain-containing protein [Granulicella sp. 5B5]|uniref:DUF481 domain-containing protein n=1 Tax=Granulicella sp. 5B5 TaxID=1617967 RepID=UPI0015F5E54E|nr:DUF481 domain-containing protein [Granulicella sp. 5B5]QMV19238.1 DUF481 domain-containing protein [Granulicella sp. 5B5]
MKDIAVRHISPLTAALSACAALASFLGLALPAQQPAKPADAKPTPDVLVFSNGDQLTGHLQSAAGGNIIFDSDMAGTLTISFDKIKELRSGDKPSQFALLKKGVPVDNRHPAPEGTAEIAGGNVIIHPDTPAKNSSSSSTPASVPTKDVDYLVSKAEFDNQISHKVGFFHAWNGTATGGATLVRSTTSASTFTAALNLIRAIPAVPWLLPRNRTTANVVETYGKNTTPTDIPAIPGVPNPTITTLSSIFHADAERDQYLSPRLYALGDLSFDHNYAQGLSFQQVYGGGIGWTAIKSSKQELDLKADIHYEKQAFITPAGSSVTPPSVNLIGSTIFENYSRQLPRKMVFIETANILPAFNNSSAYSANATASLNLPVYKRLAATVSTTDNYLNDPEPGYKKNSYQFITGVTYTLH